MRRTLLCCCALGLFVACGGSNATEVGIGTPPTIGSTSTPGTGTSGSTGGTGSTGTTDGGSTESGDAGSGFGSIAVQVVGFGNVVSSPAGLSCTDSCSSLYLNGTAVTLTASPISGSVFTGWNGACTGTTPCVLTVTTNGQVTAVATFTSP